MSMASNRSDLSDDHSNVTTPMRPRRLEVLNGPERRRKWSDETKITIVAEALGDGVSVSDVARRHDVTPSQLLGWMRQFREAALALNAPIDPPAFAPAVIDTPAIPSPPLADQLPVMRQETADD